MDEVRLLVDDKNAEAARKSSSKSDTVSSELPMDRVDVVESCMESQSSTEKNPDSQLPRRFHICSEATSEDSWKNNTKLRIRNWKMDSFEIVDILEKKYFELMDNKKKLRKMFQEF